MEVLGENPSTGSKDIPLTRHDLENGVKVTKHETYHKDITKIYSCKSDEYTSTG